MSNKSVKALEKVLEKGDKDAHLSSIKLKMKFSDKPKHKKLHKALEKAKKSVKTFTASNER